MNQSWNVPRLASNDYAAFGRCVVKWCLATPAQRPSTIGEVRTQFRAINVSLSFPIECYERDSPVGFFDTALDEWVVRLPPVELIDDTLQRIKRGEGYPVHALPAYFQAYLDGNRRYDEDFVFARLADYSITQCG